MIASKEQLPRISPEDYFAWEEQQDIKHEYFDGEVFAMSGGTQNHGRISGKIFAIIDDHLDGDGCFALNADVRVKLQESEKYTYPDVSVTCDDRDRETPQFVTHPCLIIEVLSPSTEAYDRGDKFELYRKSPSLEEYALVSADKIAIDLHRKNNHNRWELICFRAGDTVELQSINFTFPIERIYRDIKFT